MRVDSSRNLLSEERKGATEEKEERGKRKEKRESENTKTLFSLVR